MDKETALVVLEKNLDYLNTLANIGMTWWVSGVVFCGTTIAAVWLKRLELGSNPLFPWLRAGLTCFFFSIVVFGFFIMWVVDELQGQINFLKVVLKLNKGNIGIEFTAVKYGMAIGTSSFVLIIVGWLVMTHFIRKVVKAQ